MERVEGFEPSTTDWKSVMFPLHHTRMVRQTGVEPALIEVEARCTSVVLLALGALARIRTGMTGVAIQQITILPRVRGAVEGTRTLDPHLGKVVLFQLSYYCEAATPGLEPGSPE